MSDLYGYEYQWDSRYCYPNSNVLINKLGITDAAELHTAEREITAIRLYETGITRIKGDFDLAHLKRIHRFLFQEVYEWAGELRWVNIHKGNMFCNYEFIEEQAAQLFGKLKQEDWLRGTPEDSMAERLAYYLSEINVIHPFREGNGRAQRVFIEYLAADAGYDVDFSNVPDKEMIYASAAGFAREYGPMTELITRILTCLDSPE